MWFFVFFAFKHVVFDLISKAGNVGENRSECMKYVVADAWGIHRTERRPVIWDTENAGLEMRLDACSKASLRSLELYPGSSEGERV